MYYFIERGGLNNEITEKKYSINIITFYNKFLTLMKYILNYYCEKLL